MGNLVKDGAWAVNHSRFRVGVAFVPTGSPIFTAIHEKHGYSFQPPYRYLPPCLQLIFQSKGWMIQRALQLSIFEIRIFSSQPLTFAEYKI